MDILNKLSSKKFEAADDLLAFISIYDDKQRTAAYKKMMRQNVSFIKDKVCVEAGAGAGVMSEYLLKLGAKKVYAVEVNPHLYNICKSRLSKYKNAEVIKADIRNFKPSVKIDLLLHELFGQLLFDEDIHVLHHLSFEAAVIMPEMAILKYGTTTLKRMKDEVITHKMLNQLDGVLVSGLFDRRGLKLTNKIVEWNSNKPFPKKVRVTLNKSNDDLLYMGIEIHHKGKIICSSEECDNWAYVWTPIKGKSFSMDFSQRNDRLMEPVFKWL